MKRREFLKSAIYSGVGLACAPWLVNAQTNTYAGPILITIEAAGGWDTTLHFDPKVNQPNELEITHWSNEATIQSVGNINYAPVFNNEQFLQKFGDRLLVINGVDTQTNSHLTGITHSFSGRNSEGYPSLPALFSSVHAPDIPFSYLSLGGYANTSGLIMSTNVSGGHSLQNVLLRDRWQADNPYRTHKETELINQALAKDYDIYSNTDVLPRYQKAMENYRNAAKLSPSLEPFLDILPTDNDYQPEVGLGPQGSSQALSQAQLLLLACKAGVCSSGSFRAGGGYDTHQNNDELQYLLLGHLNDTIEFIWDYAEELNIADRLTLVVTSDFSRTNHYNSANGKDHWPTNSYLVMQKNATWANRTVGATDEFQNPMTINPDTLAIDNSSSGLILNPAHVHNELRKTLGLSGHINEAKFPYLLTPDVALFSSPNNTVT